MEDRKSGSAEGNPPLTSDLPIFRSSDLPKEERLRSREEEKQRQREERQRQKKLGELEKEIEIAERRINELEQAMADPAFFADHEKARLAGEEHALLTGRIAGLYGEWEELHAT
jgi:ATP-binding cassette, subfamily F, member 3